MAETRSRNSPGARGLALAALGLLLLILAGAYIWSRAGVPARDLAFTLRRPVLPKAPPIPNAPPLPERPHLPSAPMPAPERTSP